MKHLDFRFQQVIKKSSEINFSENQPQCHSAVCRITLKFISVLGPSFAFFFILKASSSHIDQSCNHFCFIFVYNKNTVITQFLIFFEKLKFEE